MHARIPKTGGVPVVIRLAVENFRNHHSFARLDLHYPTTLQRSFQLDLDRIR